MTGFRWVIEEGLASTLILNSYLFGSECLRAEGRPKEAMALALEGTEMAPDYGELWFTFARAALEAGERIKAHAGFQRATRTPSGLASIAFRDPSIADWRAVLGQAQALLSLQKVREATEVLTEARGRMPEAERVSTDLDLVKIYIQLGEPNEGWSLLKPLLEDRVDGAPLRLMELLELQLHSVGLTRTYDFIKGAMAVYPHLLDDLPLVIGALELAVANEDEISVFDLLRRAVDLGSPNREHYVLLARLLVERGEMEVARYVAECGRELPEPGEVE
jgi:tetratricopeptide (TPR) repeat protein